MFILVVYCLILGQLADFILAPTPNSLALGSSAPARRSDDQIIREIRISGFANIENLLESNPLKSRSLVRGRAVDLAFLSPSAAASARFSRSTWTR